MFNGISTAFSPTAPFASPSTLAALCHLANASYRTGRVLEEYYRDGTVIVTALVPTKIAGQVRKALDATIA